MLWKFVNSSDLQRFLPQFSTEEEMLFQLDQALEEVRDNLLATFVHTNADKIVNAFEEDEPESMRNKFRYALSQNITPSPSVYYNFDSLESAGGSNDILLWAVGWTFTVKIDRPSDSGSGGEVTFENNLGPQVFGHGGD